MKRIIALLFALLPTALAAQQFPTVPDRTVIGRAGTGSGSGPSQAIPLSVLGTQLGIQNLTSFPGATGDVQLNNAIASGVSYVALNANSTFANTVPVVLPTQFVLDCRGYYITQAASVSPSLLEMAEGAQIKNCRLNGNGTLFTGDMIDIVAGNNQRLYNVDILNTSGYNLNFAAGVGGNFLWQGGSYNRTCNSLPFTISSGTYNSSTGAVALTLSASATFTTGSLITVQGLTGTGGYLSLDGTFTSGTVSGATVNYTGASGLGASTITGGTLLQCNNNADAINLPSSESQLTGPRNFYGLEGNGSWMINLAGGNFTVIDGGGGYCLDFNSSSHYALIHNLRFACHPTILGTLHQIRGVIFDAGITLGSGLTYSTIEAQPTLTITDSSGNTTNEIISATGNIKTIYMTGGNQSGLQLLQAGNGMLDVGSNASNAPYIRPVNSLCLNIGQNTTDYYTYCAGFETQTNIAAPSSPASGKVSVWSDSTDLRLHDKNSSGVIGTTAVANAGTSHQWLSSMSAAGVFTSSQPACADISNAGTVCTQNTGTSGATVPLLNGANTWSGIQTVAASGIPIVSNSTNSAQNFQLQANGSNTGFFGSNSATPLYVQNSSGINVVSFSFSGAAANTINYPVFTAAATGTAPTLGMTGDTNRNFGVAGNGTGIVILGQAICTVSGATPQTCNGQRGIVTTGTLTTATNTDASYVINNSSVSSSSLIQCTVQAYSGTLVTNGIPHISSCVPGSTTITVHLTNINGTNALNGTVQIGFFVAN